MTKALLEKVMALSGPEKLELIDKLWESFEPGDESIEVSEEEKRLLGERWGSYEKNPSSALTIEQFDALLKETPAEMIQLRILEAVYQDVSKAANWYDSKEQFLGDRFISRFVQRMHLLSLFLGAFPTSTASIVDFCWIPFHTRFIFGSTTSLQS